ncbi:MAG TPA: hypothetical protein VFN30_01405 [Chitinophagaceae bacterium]|nr:hypothetical protein [Chitinophagaceae bacterium]
MARQDTKLESQGAEFLVLGLMLIEGISCYKSYTNFKGYDLVAVNPETEKVARIQVKSRWATNYDKGFPIKRFESDFVVHVALNRGYRFGKIAKEGDKDKRSPEFYIFPTQVVQNLPRSSWGKINIRKIPNYMSYKENWDLIKLFLD